MPLRIALYGFIEWVIDQRRKNMKEITSQIYPIFQPIKDTVKITGLSEYEIRKYLKAGKLPHRKSGVKILVNIPAFIEQLSGECGIDE